VFGTFELYTKNDNILVWLAHHELREVN